MQQKFRIILDDTDIATLRWVLDYAMDLYAEIIESEDDRVCVDDFERELEEIERLWGAPHLYRL